MSSARTWALSVGLLLAVMSCGDADNAEDAPTNASGVTAGDSAEAALVKDSNLVYLEADGHEFLVDVYAPAAEGGPWPVVVTFHGGSAQLKDNPSDRAIAEAAAEAGMVVFVPSWVQRFGTDVSAGNLSDAFAVATCALAFAEAEAPQYGGDPDRVVTHGFSAGAANAAWLALGHAGKATTGCATDRAATTPVGAVLGDSEYFFHTSLFDNGFETERDAMLVHVAALVDPTTWADDRADRFRLWSAERGTQSRPFTDPWDEEGWFARRDPDGSIRGDLDELGQLDDRSVSFVDQGLLLGTRLQRAGADATVDAYPGDHTVLDKIPEIVDYLLDAAGRD